MDDIVRGENLPNIIAIFLSETPHACAHIFTRSTPPPLASVGANGGRHNRRYSGKRSDTTEVDRRSCPYMREEQTIFLMRGPTFADAICASQVVEFSCLVGGYLLGEPQMYTRRQQAASPDVLLVDRSNGLGPMCVSSPVDDVYAIRKGSDVPHDRPPQYWSIRYLLCVAVMLPTGGVTVHRCGFAQSASAAINGTITDPTAAVIPAARIVLCNVDTGIERNTSSGTAGTYSITDMVPGNYSLQVMKNGFATSEMTGIALEVNQTATLDFRLTVGLSQQTVTVNANLSAGVGLPPQHADKILNAFFTTKTQARASDCRSAAPLLNRTAAACGLPTILLAAQNFVSHYLPVTGYTIQW
ncbi:MAG TPA: carboxypeptidase-like regulatory domain-containing protein [Granulicella sp.]|jgi:hypothetical protein|nr:carboxypeptidase-like regulatory domain-containing protein [Granulicella sp.]